MCSSDLQWLNNDHWIKKHGVHVSWQKLIDALQTYIDHYRSWSWGECEEYWCLRIGGAQLNLPAHVIQEYCRIDRSFYPCPLFNEKLLPRNGEPLVKDWYVQNELRLGKDFAYFRGSKDRVTRQSSHCRVWTLDLRPRKWIEPDRIALATLLDLRQSQYAQLLEKVSNSIEHPSSPLLPPPPLLHSPTFISPRTTQQELTKFLRHIGFGEQDEAEGMLKSNYNLAILYGDLTDCADRHFEKITGLQYAIWALDYHMWTMIKKYLNLYHARSQIVELNTGSWVRTFGENWKSLIDLNIFNISYIKNEGSCWKEKNTNRYWCQQIGGTQLMFPAHIINEYCHPLRAFRLSTLWNDQEESLPRKGVDIWRRTSLGHTFAWVRGGSMANYYNKPRELHVCNNIERCHQKTENDSYCGCDFCTTESMVLNDQFALKKLLRSRTKQAQNLISKLTLQPNKMHPF